MLGSRTEEDRGESVTWKARDPMLGSIRKRKKNRLFIAAQRTPLFQLFYLNYIYSLQL